MFYHVNYRKYYRLVYKEKMGENSWVLTIIIIDKPIDLNDLPTIPSTIDTNSTRNDENLNTLLTYLLVYLSLSACPSFSSSSFMNAAYYSFNTI